MKKEAIFFVLGILFFILFSTQGCNKTDSPFGVYAPNGLDNPFVSGSFNVSVQDYGSAPVSGANVMLVDPDSNTFTAQTTSTGIAAFNLGNIRVGAWTAILPAQTASLNNAPFSIAQSTQAVTVSSTGVQNVSFSRSGQSVSLAPLSQAFPLFIPLNMALTLAYAETGNLNVPVSVTLEGLSSSSYLTSSFYTPATIFVFNGGVTSVPLNITKGGCYSANVPVSVSVSDFGGNHPFNSLPATLVKNYPVSVFESVGQDGSGNYVLYLTTIHDCGITWNYMFQETNTGTTIVTGTVTSGGSVTFHYSGAYENVNFNVTSYIGSAHGNYNLFSIPASGTVSLIMVPPYL